MSRVPATLRLYLLGTYAAAAILVAATMRSWPDGSWQRAVSIHGLVLGCLIALAKLHPVLLAPGAKFGYKVSVGTAPVFAALLLLGTPAAIVVAATSVLIANIVLRRRYYNILFNVAQTGGYVAVAGLVAFHIAPRALPLRIDGWQGASAVVAAAAASYIVNSWVVATAVALQTKRSPWQLWRSHRRHDVVQELALYLLGVLLLLTAGPYPWSVLLVAIPVAVVHWSFLNSLQVRLQTREAIEELADVVEQRDSYARHHSRRVADWSVRLAAAMHLPHEEAELIRLAARVHDIGNINLPHELFGRAGPLSDDEAKQMRSHPEVGAKIISKFPDYQFGKDIVLAHHERVDGTGYPRRLKGDEIPMGARIVAVADAFDAMTSPRAHRAAMSRRQALNEIARNAGAQHDLLVVAAMLDLVDADIRDEEARARNADGVAPLIPRRVAT